MELNINIKNIKPNQAIALVNMLKKMEYCGKAGTTQYVGFFADGDGDFHPKIEVNIPENISGKYYEKSCVFRDGKRTHLPKNDPNNKLIENKFPWTGAITLFDYDGLGLKKEDEFIINGGV